MTFGSGPDSGNISAATAGRAPDARAIASAAVGLAPDAPNGRLYVVRPRLPFWLRPFASFRASDHIGDPDAEDGALKEAAERRAAGGTRPGADALAGMVALVRDVALGPI